MDVFVALLTLDSLDSNIKANCPCIAVVFPSKRKYYEEMRNALVTVDGGRNPAGGSMGCSPSAGFRWPMPTENVLCPLKKEEAPHL